MLYLPAAWAVVNTGCFSFAKKFNGFNEFNVLYTFFTVDGFFTLSELDNELFLFNKGFTPLKI